MTTGIDWVFYKHASTGMKWVLYVDYAELWTRHLGVNVPHSITGLSLTQQKSGPLQMLYIHCSTLHAHLTKNENLYKHIKGIVN